MKLVVDDRLLAALVPAGRGHDGFRWVFQSRINCFFQNFVSKQRMQRCWSEEINSVPKFGTQLVFQIRQRKEAGRLFKIDNNVDVAAWAQLVARG